MLLSAETRRRDCISYLQEYNAAFKMQDVLYIGMWCEYYILLQEKDI